MIKTYRHRSPHNHCFFPTRDAVGILCCICFWLLPKPWLWHRGEDNLAIVPGKWLLILQGAIAITTSQCLFAPTTSDAMYVCVGRQHRELKGRLTETLLISPADFFSTFYPFFDICNIVYHSLFSLSNSSVWFLDVEAAYPWLSNRI